MVVAVPRFRRPRGRRGSPESYSSSSRAVVVLATVRAGILQGRSQSRTALTATDLATGPYGHTEDDAGFSLLSNGHHGHMAPRGELLLRYRRSSGPAWPRHASHPSALPDDRLMPLAAGYCRRPVRSLSGSGSPLRHHGPKLLSMYSDMDPENLREPLSLIYSRTRRSPGIGQLHCTTSGQTLKSPSGFLGERRLALPGGPCACGAALTASGAVRHGPRRHPRAGTSVGATSCHHPVDGPRVSVPGIDNTEAACSPSTTLASSAPTAPTTSSLRRCGPTTCSTSVAPRVSPRADRRFTFPHPDPAQLGRTVKDQPRLTG